MSKTDWEKIAGYQEENKNLLIMVADPKTDEIRITYGGFNTFVKFPMKEQIEGVVFNALRESDFKDAITPLIEGVVESTGITPTSKGGNELLKVVGGAIKGIGTAKAAEIRSNLQKFTKDEPKKHEKSRTKK